MNQGVLIVLKFYCHQIKLPALTVLQVLKTIKLGWWEHLASKLSPI